MNLTVTSTGFHPDTCVLITALEILTHIHQDFTGEVSIVVNQECPKSTRIKIPSIGIGWVVCMNGVCEDNYWDIMNRTPTDEACAKIRELTSPRVDQPAPARTAADAQRYDRIWYINGSTGKVEYANVDSVGNEYISMIPISVVIADFGIKWGYAEEQHP